MEIFGDVMVALLQCAGVVAVGVGGLALNRDLQEFKSLCGRK